jgi:hypothetical protein
MCRDLSAVSIQYEIAPEQDALRTATLPDMLFGVRKQGPFPPPKANSLRIRVEDEAVELTLSHDAVHCFRMVRCPYFLFLVCSTKFGSLEPYDLALWLKSKPPSIACKVGFLYLWRTNAHL